MSLDNWGSRRFNLLDVKCIDGQVQSTGGQVICAARKGETPVSQVLGIRPEDIDPSGGEHAGKVLVVEDAPPNSILLVRWLGYDIRLLAPRRSAVRAGDDIFPRIRTDRAMLWPMETNA